jgi:hypothetical protein
MRYGNQEADITLRRIVHRRELCSLDKDDSLAVAAQVTRSFKISERARLPNDEDPEQILVKALAAAKAKSDARQYVAYLLSLSHPPPGYALLSASAG